MTYLLFLCPIHFVIIFLNSYVSVVGLTNSSTGRSCDQHDICGKVVEVGSVLHIRLVPAWRRGRWVDDLVVYFFIKGVDICKVVFLAKEHEADAALLDGKFIRVIDLYSIEDDDITKRMLFYQKYGFAKAIVVPAPENV